MTTNPPVDPEDVTPGAVPPDYSAPPPVAVPPEPGYSVPPPDFSAPPPGAVPPAPGYAVPPAPGYAAPPYGAPQGYPPAYAGVGAPISDSDQRMWAMLSHLGGVFVSFVVPLVVYLIYKGRGVFVEDQAKEALNFQITLVIAYAISGLSIFILVGFLLFPAVVICAIVFAIIAAVKSNQGILYRYPVCIRFIK